MLRQKLRQELEFGQTSIARDKANLMEGAKTSQWAMQLKLKREAELKERIAAFAVFTKNAERAKKLSGNLQVCTDPAPVGRLIVHPPKTLLYGLSRTGLGFAVVQGEGGERKGCT